MENRINTETGSFRLNRYIEFGNGTAQELLLSQCRAEAQPCYSRDYNNGWTISEIENYPMDTLFFRFTFRFYQQKLKQADFVFYEEKYPAEGSWDDWNLDIEMQKKERYDQWLNLQIGERRKFPWGSLFAAFDERAACSFIFLIYQ